MNWGWKMKALILAGGFAKRLGPIGEQIPKAMLPTEGDTILNHILRKLEKEGIEAIISTNKRFEPFFRAYKNIIVEDVMREEEKLGAVSAISYAIKRVGIHDDLLVICVDNYFSSDLRGFISSFEGVPQVGIYYMGGKLDMMAEEMATVKFEGSDRYPPPRENFYIQDFKEKMKPPLSRYASMGIYLFPKRIFPILDEFCRVRRQDAPGFFIQYLLERGEKLKGYLFRGEWYDITHKSYLQAFRDGKLVKSDERYVVVDRPLGGNLMLSITILHPGKHTTGHSHSVPEVYFFIEGEGEIELGTQKHLVREKDVISVRPNEFHRIYNTSNRALIFVCAFEKYGERS